jgi:polyhydroxyalkanoate synthesis regulator phasin
MKLKYFLMGVGSIFDGFGRIFNDPFCIKLNKEFVERGRILKEKHKVIMDILAESKKEVQKPVDNWDMDRLNYLWAQHEKARQDYEDFANKNIRNYWK